MQDDINVFACRFSELSAWVTSKESQLRLLRNRAGDPSKFGQVKSTIEVRNGQNGLDEYEGQKVLQIVLMWFIESEERR